MFASWLQAELDRRGWSQADLARASGLSPAQIARLLSGARGIGNEGLAKIANALKMRPETVMRAAGALPTTTPKAALVDHAGFLLEQLDEADQEAWVRMLEAYLAQRKSRNPA